MAAGAEALSPGFPHRARAELTAALESVRAQLGLDIGLVSRIENEDYFIEAATGTEDLAPGMRFELGDTYCSLTWQANDVVTIADVENSNHAGHPCYRRFDLRAYVGVPLRVSGKRFGTLNFSSTRPRTPISEGDVILLRILAGWVERTLEQSDAERELARHRALLAGFFAAIPDACMITNPDHRVHLVNPAFQRSFGYTEDEIRDQTTEALFVTPSRLNSEDPPESSAPSTNQLVSCRRRDGRTFPAETTRAPIRTDDGRCLGHLEIVRDVTERRAAEAALVTARARLASLFEAVPDLILELTGDGHILSEQGQKCHATPLSDRFAPPVAASLAAAAQKALETRGLERVEYQEDAHQQRWTFDCRLCATGQNTVVAVSRNITQLKRTLDRLRAANETLDRFAYIASHDLRSPLRAIRQLIEWIEEDSDPPLAGAAHNHFTSLRARVLRMEHLLEGLMTYSRAGQLRADPERVDTETLVTRLIDSHLEVPEGFAVEIGFLPTLMTARSPLEHALVNLLSNALKHHDRPTGTIRVRAEEDASAVLFMIEDDGPGIEPRHHEQAFEIFRRLRPHPNSEGGGLGLAIARQLARSAGGDVTLESPLHHGRGSRFVLHWPRRWNPSPSIVTPLRPSEE